MDVGPPDAAPQARTDFMIRLPEWLSPKSRRLAPSQEAADTRHSHDGAEALLRPVSTADAVARTIHVETSFAPWRIDAMEDVAGRRPLPHQAELAYEASSIAYEHGFAFVEAPAASGKTKAAQNQATRMRCVYRNLDCEAASDVTRRYETFILHHHLRGS